MFTFAIAATTILYVYWKLHIGPFLPIQRALAEEFRGSRPRVEGGQRKMHKGTPRILRVTMKVDFDPDVETERSQALAQRAARFCAKRGDLASYDVFEAHFYWPEPEKELHEWSMEIPVSSIEADEG